MRDVWESPAFQAGLTQVAADNTQRAARGRPLHTGFSAIRQYGAARDSRLTADWSAPNTSADSELVSSLTKIRSRARALIRDVSYAKRAQIVVVNNVIGTGIGMQAQVMNTRGQLNERVNAGIEEAWSDWTQAENCHTGGRLSFKHLERALMSQVFSAGEVFIRKHYQRFGTSQVPFALELIEAERLADELSSPFVGARNGNEVRMGIEMDRFHRPIAYYIRRGHPNEFRLGYSTEEVERVPADQIIHLAVVDRWPQTRGEPWMHAVARTLNDMAGYTEAEITRARVQAATPWTIETTDDIGEEQPDGSMQMQSEPGVIQRLNPGEKMNAPAPNAPNPALDPFMRYMIREFCAGAGVSYESVSRDYSQGTYSSMRISLLDDRDTWRFYQSWFICDFRYRIHKEWLQQAVLARAVDGVSVEQYALTQKKFEAVLFKPRGWSWIDPTKEVEAYKEAIKAGLTTRTDVIAQTAGGQDIEDVDNVRERELRMAKEKGLQFDTDPEFYMSDATKAQAEAKAAAKPPDKPDTNPQSSESTPPARGFSSLKVAK